MTEASATAQPCKAVEDDGLMLCERCGLQWIAGVEKPPCNPITLKRLYDRMAVESVLAENSWTAVVGLQRGGKVPADAAEARMRFCEIDAARRLIDRCMSNNVIKAELNGKAKQGDSK